MCLHLVVGEIVVLVLLLRLERGPIILIIALLPLLVLTNLPNHQVNILRRVIHGCFPIALQILILRNECAVTAQFMRCQQQFTSIADVIPTMRISLTTCVGPTHAVYHRLQGDLNRTERVRN
jgi:hypothetical protein